jgi:putative membrane protein
MTEGTARQSARLPLALLAITAALLIWSGIRPFDYPTWILEVAPALAGIVVLAATFGRFQFTPLLYTLIAAHMILLAIGGHYTYALVPFGNWVRDWLNLTRNHYDRLGHFAQGFVPAMIARELFVRLRVVSTTAWRNFLTVCVCLAISAVYELLEWFTALVLGQKSDSFLGTQGDTWDTQQDMFMAMVGAVCALALLSRWHDSQLRRIVTPEPDAHHPR